MRSPPSQLRRHDASGVEAFSVVWRGHRTQSHAHPEYQLTLTEAGCGRFDYLAGRALIPRGCLALFHPGEPHVLANADRGAAWRLRSLSIPARWLEAGGVPLRQPVPLLVDGLLGTAFAAVWEAVADPRQDPARALPDLAASLRARPGLEPDARPRSAVVRRCLEHLAATLDRPVSCAELAAVSGATSAQVRRALHAATGLPPQAWHLQRRIYASKHRLGRGEAISAVALALGFADQAHFTRHFTRLVGVSPARYGHGRPGPVTRI
jgi:AraC-like DNA-binding protein